LIGDGDFIPIQIQLTLCFDGLRRADVTDWMSINISTDEWS
jgi:hypothetical protein